MKTLQQKNIERAQKNASAFQRKISTKKYQNAVHAARAKKEAEKEKSKKVEMKSAAEILGLV